MVPRLVLIHPTFRPGMYLAVSFYHQIPGSGGPEIDAGKDDYFSASDEERSRCGDLFSYFFFFNYGTCVRHNTLQVHSRQVRE